jgi:hypothetical protein
VKARLAIAGTLAGLAILAAVVVVAFQFGRVDPSPPSLLDRPNPAIPGEILYQEHEGCLVRATASGAGRAEVCSAAVFYYGPFYWVDTETVLVFGGQEIIELDLATGETSSAGIPGSQYVYPERPPVSVRGERATAEGGTLYAVSSGGRQEITSFDVGSRWIEPVLWSPDGDWLVVQYYPPRGSDSELWIVSRDGETRGTLTDEAIGSWVAWRIEGIGATPEYKGRRD